MKMVYTVETDRSRIYPLGVTARGDGYDVSFVSKVKNCGLLLFEKGKKRPSARIPFPAEGRMGDVHFMTVRGSFDDLEYAFWEDDRETPDPFGRRCTGWDRWGKRDSARRCIRTPFDVLRENFDWEDDCRPAVPTQDCVVYKIHARGFTKHISSGVSPQKRGTFAGVAEKIPYMKELGITTVEMMPPSEFDEVIRSPRGEVFGLPKEGAPARGYCAAAGESRGRRAVSEKAEPVKVNYWGYCRSFAFAPKTSYASDGACEIKDPVTEFKSMVKALHRAGLELVIELYFDGTEAPGYVLDAVRFWAMEYHVDGVPLVGFAPLSLLAADPYLKDIKLWGEGWETEGDFRRICEYNSGFMQDMRRFLKGDEGMLNAFAYHLRRNPGGIGVINYMANVNGFTMMDMVSYNEKHNEDNGEENRDGTDCNQSWNCGAEGTVRKKRIRQLRMQQLRNAVLLLFLSQGTPLLLSGDELGQSKRGNNNSYCQDNEISWLNWDLLERDSRLYEFVRAAISFRKSHDLFHMEQEPGLMDYKGTGLPDLSYHGEKAWQPEFDRHCRQLGAFYCGAYGKGRDGKGDASFYTAYNMHWEPHEFALPNLPKGREWRMVFNTAEDSVNGFWAEKDAPVLKDQKKVMAAARSVCVFMEGPVHGKGPASEERGQKNAE